MMGGAQSMNLDKEQINKWRRLEVLKISKVG